jgi:hypothetical protein
MSNDSRPDPLTPRERGTGGRKPYRPPVLTEYGSISKLTRGTSSTRNDPSSPMMRPK